MSRRRRETPTIQVGTHVLVPLLWHKLEAVVIEHRGFIGVGGREIVCIQPVDSDDDRGPFEMPVEELEVISGPTGDSPAPPSAAGRRGGGLRSVQPMHLPVGAHVRVLLPHSTLDMEVLEDRGIVDGRQVVRVRSLDHAYVHADFEVAAEDVEVLSMPKAKRGRAAA